MGRPSISARGGWAVAVAAAVAAAAFGPPLAAVTNAAPGPDGASGAPGDEACLVSRINAARQAAGAAALSAHSGLTSVGRRHSAEMAAAGRWYHSSDLGSKVRPLGAVKWGENVGWATDCSYMSNFFMNSTVHRNNRLNPIFTHVGVGVVVADDGKIWVTEVFTRSGSSAPLQNAPMRTESQQTPSLPAPTAAPPPLAAGPAPPAKAASPKASAKAANLRPQKLKGKIEAYKDILETEPGLPELKTRRAVIVFDLAEGPARSRSR